MSNDWLPKLRPALESLCSAWTVPLGVAVGWIQVESGGRLAEVTTLGERGYFQLMPSESKDLGVQHERLTTDSMYSLSSGFKLLNYYSRSIGRMLRIAGIECVPVGSEYHWRLCKLAHSMGLGATRTIVSDAAEAKRISSWEELRTFALDNDEVLLKKTKHAPSKWFALVDRVFVIGAPLGVERLRTTV